MTRDGKQQLEVDFQPFLRLGKYLSEEFMAVAEELLFLVGVYGMSKTPSEPTNEEELGQFFAHVHDGWKQAQVRIAELLTDALARQAAAQADEKEQHRQRNKKGLLLRKSMASRCRYTALVGFSSNMAGPPALATRSPAPRCCTPFGSSSAALRWEAGLAGSGCRDGPARHSWRSRWP